MSYITVIGKPEHVSKEEVRAMAQATAAVLEYHNLKIATGASDITIRIVSKIPGTCRVGGQPIGGQATRSQRLIKVLARFEHEEMFNAVIHEMIHLYMSMPERCIEKCTSTLTGKLLPDIAKLYTVLVDGVYRRAAYIAHTRLSYRPDVEDYYDTSYETEQLKTAPGERFRHKGVA